MAGSTSRRGDGGGGGGGGRLPWGGGKDAWGEERTRPLPPTRHERTRPSREGLGGARRGAATARGKERATAERHRGVPRATAGARVPGARPRARLGLGASHRTPPAGPGKPGRPGRGTGTTAGPATPTSPLRFFSPHGPRAARERAPREGKPWRAFPAQHRKGLGVFLSLHRFRLHLGGRRARVRNPAKKPPAAHNTPGGAQHPGGGD